MYHRRMKLARRSWEYNLYTIVQAKGRDENGIIWVNWILRCSLPLLLDVVSCLDRRRWSIPHMAANSGESLANI
jgi:hypothetical protein